MSQVLLTVVFSLIIALLATYLVARLQSRAARERSPLFSMPDDDPVFLFDEEDLLDTSAAGRAILARQKGGGSDWQRFLHWAAPRFTGVERALEQLPDLGSAEIEHDDLVLRAEWRGGLRHILLSQRAPSEAVDRLHGLARRADREEAALLHEIMNDAPAPICRLGPEGTVVWANQAYGDLALQQVEAAGDPVWPLPSLFPAATPGRHSLTLPGNHEPLWFDCHVAPSEKGVTIFAMPAGDLVQAERALGSFVQTLTKTFGYLPIGLAIFDQSRKLQLFNPALTDLTGLPVEFLSARPGLFGLFDAMRERGMIPEPRDYKSWRAQMAALERSASDGNFEETWTLPSGLTYRVMGRPHPEGALALLFQDISDEVARARRMRADLELGQSVIDTADEAIAVFSSSGLLVMSNTAYARLWGHDPSVRPEAMSVTSLAGEWRRRSAPDSFWDEAEHLILSGAPRTTRQSLSRLLDGRVLRCRLAPLAGGATLIGFSETSATGPAAVQPPAPQTLPGLAAGNRL